MKQQPGGSNLQGNFLVSSTEAYQQMAIKEYKTGADPIQDLICLQIKW
jgi:hypothetical protein